jgi:ribosomal-protein-alanine N-acetyltransferase
MEIEDIPAVLEIERECLIGSWSFEAYTKELSTQNSASLVAFEISETEQEIIGFVFVRLITSVNESEILNIAVRPQFRNIGVGNVLLREIIEYLKSKRIKIVWLEVRKFNLPAQKLYLRNGFEICGARRNYYQNPSEDALLMKLVL